MKQKYLLSLKSLTYSWKVNFAWTFVEFFFWRQIWRTFYTLYLNTVFMIYILYMCLLMQKKSHETPKVDHFSTQCGHHTQLGTRWQMTLILKSSARLGCTYRSRCTFPIGTITIIFIWLMQHEELTGAYGPPKCYKLVSLKINGRFYDHYTQGNFGKKRASCNPFLKIFRIHIENSEIFFFVRHYLIFSSV